MSCSVTGIGDTLQGMRELTSIGTDRWNQLTSVRVRELATRQFGVISWAQLIACGLSKTTISRWIAQGRLVKVHPRVYALGHKRLSIEGRLNAALLYAGPRAALSHATALWWWGLTDKEPTMIEVTTPARRPSIAGVRTHNRQRPQTTTHNDLPTTTVAQTLLDFASVATSTKLLRALAEADFKRLLNDEHLNTIAGRGRPGSTKLRRALDEHRPELARTRRELEEAFQHLLAEHPEIPIPEVNPKVCGFRADALWRDHKLIVELDGYEAHSTPARIEHDHQRDLTHRQAGYVVLRYTWSQIKYQPDAVIADLKRHLGLP